MATSRSLRLRRRGMLGIPALVVAAATVAATSAPASAAPATTRTKPVECLADLIEEA